MRVKVIQRHMADWDIAVTLVRKKYKEYFGADIRPTPDFFAVYYNSGQIIKACGGITEAKGATLFSEQYLLHPIERLIADIEKCEVKREDIVEVGSLASISKEAGSELMLLIPLLAWCMRKKYILCTATVPLCHLLARLGINFTPLGAATLSCLDEDHLGNWGTYYDHSPQAGYIDIAAMVNVYISNTGRYAFRDLEIDLLPRERKIA